VDVRRKHKVVWILPELEQPFCSRDVKLSPGSECKIVFLGLFAGVNLIPLRYVSEAMLNPSSGPLRFNMDSETSRNGINRRRRTAQEAQFYNHFITCEILTFLRTK
jgi:hypothetical protein